MACSIQLGDACLFLDDVACIAGEQSPVRSQGLLLSAPPPQHHLETSQLLRMQGASSPFLDILSCWECPGTGRIVVTGLLEKEEKIISSNSNVKLIYKLERNSDISSSRSEVNHASPWIGSLTNKPKAATGGGCYLCSSGLFLASFSIMHHSPRPQGEMRLRLYIGLKGCACNILSCQVCPGELSSQLTGA